MTDEERTGTCMCSCHSCCVPLDASCGECEDNHEWDADAWDGEGMTIAYDDGD